MHYLTCGPPLLLCLVASSKLSNSISNGELKRPTEPFVWTLTSPGFSTADSSATTIAETFMSQICSVNANEARTIAQRSIFEVMHDMHRTKVKCFVIHNSYQYLENANSHQNALTSPLVSSTVINCCRVIDCPHLQKATLPHRACLPSLVNLMLYHTRSGKSPIQLNLDNSGGMMPITRVFPDCRNECTSKATYISTLSAMCSSNFRRCSRSRRASQPR
jgi:hypothetical protein